MKDGLNIDLELLQDWFNQEKRDFPWRRSPTPYRVWISEVMLQQTQASRVVHFFERWMERFPSISALANASEQEVLKMWEGLGYYSRARLLHQAAKFLESDCGGQIPNDVALLKQIKGLGPYTIGAIRAFAFHERAAAVDANVIRVLARLFEIEEDISLPKTKEKIWALATELLPEKEAWVIAEALIELGASICRPKNPDCERCPLKMQCRSFAEGREKSIPVNSKRTQYETLFREVAVIVCKESMLLKQGEPGKVMAGLYEFPYFACSENGFEPDHMRSEILQNLAIDVAFSAKLAPVKHSYTRFRVTLYPKLFIVDREIEVKGCAWHPITAKKNLAFSSGHKRVLEALDSLLV